MLDVKYYEKLFNVIYDNIPHVKTKPAFPSQVDILSRKNIPSYILNIAIKDRFLSSWIISKSSKNDLNVIDFLEIFYDIAIIRRAKGKFTNDLRNLINNIKVLDELDKKVELKISILNFIKKYGGKIEDE